MIGFRITFPTLARWEEPPAFAHRNRENRLLPRWRTCVLWTATIFGGWLLLWHFGVVIRGVNGLVFCLVAAALTAFFCLVLIPLGMRANGSRVVMGSSLMSWGWGICGGAIRYRQAKSFEWIEEYGLLVLSLSRHDGGPPFEVAVPDEACRARVTAILRAMGIPWISSQGNQP